MQLSLGALAAFISPSRKRKGQSSALGCCLSAVPGRFRAHANRNRTTCPAPWAFPPSPCVLEPRATELRVLALRKQEIRSLPTTSCKWPAWLQSTNPQCWVFQAKCPFRKVDLPALRASARLAAIETMCPLSCRAAVPRATAKLAAWSSCCRGQQLEEGMQALQKDLHAF